MKICVLSRALSFVCFSEIPTVLVLADHTTIRMGSEEVRLWWPWHYYPSSHCAGSAWIPGSVHPVQPSEETHACEGLRKIGQWWKVMTHWFEFFESDTDLHSSGRRVSACGAHGQGSIPGQVKPETLQLALRVEHYLVCIVTGQVNYLVILISHKEGWFWRCGVANTVFT